MTTLKRKRLSLREKVDILDYRDDDLATIQLLPYLFNPVNIKVPKKTTGNNVTKYSMRRPTKLEQASSVIVHITNINDLKSTHEEKVNRAFNCGLTVQPYVAIVGNLEEINTSLSYYTVINDIYHKLETPIKALDIYFKSFNSFNLEYSQEAEQHEFDSNPKINLNKTNTLNLFEQITDQSDHEKYLDENIGEKNNGIPLADDLMKIRSNAISMIYKCIDTNVKGELSVILNEMKILSDPFVFMKTEYMRFETLEELGVLIHPKELVIGHRLGDELVNGRVSVEPTDVKICLIPLRNIFKKNLEHSNLLDVILKYTENMKSKNTGIFVTVSNKVHHIFFSLGLIIGDNLGLHSILGFTESFVSSYPCRFCKTIKNECHVQTTEIDINLRNNINYADDLEINDVLFTGVKESCVWNEISSFHVTQNYCVDIMLEGVCNYDIGLMLKIMIFDLKYFTIDKLNNRIELFDYGPVDIRNRPTLIASETLKGKGKKLKMSAGEMLCFVKNLGLIIGDLVPLNSEICNRIYWAWSMSRYRPGAGNCHRQVWTSQISTPATGRAVVSPTVTD
ncbi:hypothetical protein ACI65C_005062 [Semiaphis heraclei]